MLIGAETTIKTVRVNNFLTFSSFVLASKRAITIYVSIVIVVSWLETSERSIIQSSISKPPSKKSSSENSMKIKFHVSNHGIQIVLNLRQFRHYSANSCHSYISRKKSTFEESILRKI